ncbi:MAG: hypothetical protein WBF87_16090 [Mesorhizobium sp.]
MKFQLLVLSAALALAGCATSTPSNSIVGGFVGPTPRPQAPAGRAIIAALGGGLIGGAQLSGAERSQALEAEYKALEYTPVGQPVLWGDLQGRRGEVRAAQPYRVGSQDCRQYTHTIVLTGQPQMVRGTACRNPDGSWSVLT